MMHRYILSLLIVMALVLSSDVSADENEIYVVDIQSVLEQSIVGKAARNDIEAEVKKSQAKLEVERTKIASLEKTTKKQVALLSQDAAGQKLEQLRKEQRDFARLVQDEKESIARLKDRKLGKIVDQIDNVIDEIADEKKYPLVIESDPRLVLYAGDKYDITKEVLKRLDKRNFDL